MRPEHQILQKKRQAQLRQDASRARRETIRAELVSELEKDDENEKCITKLFDVELADVYWHREDMGLTAIALLVLYIALERVNDKYGDKFGAALRAELRRHLKSPSTKLPSWVYPPRV